MLHAVVFPWSRKDDEDEARLLKQVPALTYSTRPSAGDMYAEYAVYTSRADSGNVIGILPVPPDKFRGKETGERVL